VNIKKYILVALLCLISLSSYSQSKSYPNRFIKSIEHGVYIDHHLVFPYTHIALTTKSQISFELGMLDIPSRVNFRFNQTIQQQAGNLAWMVSNVEEFAEYKGRPRKKEFSFLIGATFQKNKFRYVLQTGRSTTELYLFKFSHYYRVIGIDNGFVDLGLHWQLGEKRRFVFFGYSWGIF
jgi:hypothetical protein